MECEPFASDRVRESQVGGMEHDSWKKESVLPSLFFVDRVSGQRISQMLHVNPDLVGSSGEKGDVQERIPLPVRCHDPVSRLGGFPPGSDGKLLAVPVGSADGGINETSLGRRNPYRQGNVAF